MLVLSFSLSLLSFFFCGERVGLGDIGRKSDRLANVAAIVRVVGVRTKRSRGVAMVSLRWSEIGLSVREPLGAYPATLGELGRRLLG